MNPVLAVLAILVLAGGVMAVSVTDGRLALLGLAGSLLVAPFLADPEPTTLGLAARVVAATLAVWLPWTIVRDGRRLIAPSVAGWPAEAAAAAAAGLAGLASHGLGLQAAGPAAAQAAGFGLLAVGLVAAFGREPLRLGVGLTLLVLAATLVRAGLGPTPGPLEELAIGGLLVAVLGSTAVLVSAAGHLPGTDAVRTEAHRPSPDGAAGRG